MALFPERLGRTNDPARMAEYIRYMAETLERQNAALLKRIAALEKEAGRQQGAGETDT